MKIKLWQKWILGGGAIGVLGTAGVLSLFIYAKQPISQGYENKSKLPINNNLNDFKEISNYQMDLLDPISLQKVSEFKYDKDSNGQINGVDAKKWIDDFLVEKGQSPLLSVYAGPINFINEYTEVFLPKDFIEYIHWYSQNVAWSPGLSSISTFRIKKGIEKENNNLIQGSFSAKLGEKKVIKFIPDSFFQQVDVFSFIRRLTKAPSIKDSVPHEESGITKEELKSYVREINKFNKAKKAAAKEDEMIHLYSFEEVKNGALSIRKTKEFGGENEKLYVPTFILGGKRMKESFDKNLTRFAKEVSDIFPQLDEDGNFIVADGVKKALSIDHKIVYDKNRDEEKRIGDKIPYLELQRAVALDNWKGIDSHFLKYVTTHEYGHMLTLGSMNDTSTSSTSVGFPNKKIGAANAGGAIDIEAFNLYLAARVPNIKAKLAKPHTIKDANGVEQWVLYEDDLAKWEKGGKIGPKPHIFSYLNVMFEYTANPSGSNIDWKKLNLDNIFPGKVDTLSNDSPVDLSGGIKELSEAIDNPDNPNVKKFLFLTRDINDLRAFAKSLSIPLEAVWLMVNFDNFIQTLLPDLLTGRHETPFIKTMNEESGEWENIFNKVFALENNFGEKYFKEQTSEDLQNFINEMNMWIKTIQDEKAKASPDANKIAKWEDHIQIYYNFFKFGKHPQSKVNLFLNLEVLAKQLNKKKEDLTKAEFDDFLTLYKELVDLGNVYEIGNERAHTGFDSRIVSTARSISVAEEFSRKLINDILNDPDRTNKSVEYQGSNIYENLKLNSFKDVEAAWGARNTYGMKDNASAKQKANGAFYKRKLAFTSINGTRYVGKHYSWVSSGRKANIAMPALYDLINMQYFGYGIYNYWKEGDGLFNLYDKDGKKLETTINIADAGNTIGLQAFKDEYQAQKTKLKLPTPGTNWKAFDYAIVLRNAIAKEATQFKINRNAVSKKASSTNPKVSYLKDIDETKLEIIDFKELLSILMPQFSDLTFDTNSTFKLGSQQFQNEISLQSQKNKNLLINNPTLDETKALGAHLYSAIYEDPLFGFEDDKMNEDKFWELINKLRQLTDAQIKKGKSNTKFQQMFLNQFKTLVFDGKKVIETTEQEVREWYNFYITKKSNNDNKIYFDKKPFELKTMAMLASLSTQPNGRIFEGTVYHMKGVTEKEGYLIWHKTHQAPKEPSILEWLKNPKGSKNASSVNDLRTTYLYSLSEVLTRDYVLATMPVLSLNKDEFRYGSTFTNIKVGTGGYDLYFNPKKYMFDSQDKIYDFVLKSKEYNAKIFDPNDSVLAQARKAMPQEIQNILSEISPAFVKEVKTGIEQSIGLIKTKESGYQKDRWLRSAINDGEANGQNWQIYDDTGQPVKDTNIRIKGLDGKDLADSQKDRAYAYWLYLLKSYGVGDRTISNVWREPKRDGLSMWGYIRQEDAEQVKYLKATKTNGEVKYFPIRQNIDNLFYLKKQGDINSKHTLADEGFVSWTTEKFIVTGKWSNADLTLGQWQLEFVDANKKPALDAATGKNLFTMGSREKIIENNKPYEYAPIILTQDEEGNTIATIKNQFGGLEGEN